ncbi:MAG: methyltransferase domain-containing protein [Firmicutes bacterium]|nr:methyltransferase domain-containing protein [Bacillota bacterium]
MGCLTVLKNRKGNAALILKYEDIFSCPICSSKMKLVNAKSLICNHHHCFDVSRRGYINMLPHPGRGKYDQSMFESRRIVYRSGLFEPLVEKISREMINNIESNRDRVLVLDAGCGEGFMLSSITDRLSQNAVNRVSGIGVDVSKAGISMASGEYPEGIWCVASISRCPFEGKQFDFILNVLSPSNYSEFQRLLSDDGTVVKVIPESGYLQELREVFYERTDRGFYSNEKTMELFKSSLVLLDIQRLRYSATLDNTLIRHLARMTPLSWGATRERLQKVLEMDAKEITIDLAILLGRKKNQGN